MAIRDRPSPSITAASITGSSGIDPLFRAKAPLTERALGSRQNDVRDLGHPVRVRGQRNRVVRHVRPEDREATLRDEFVVRALDGVIGAVGQPDDVALHQLDRAIDHPGGDSFVEDQPDRVHGVVVGARSRRIVVEQAYFQGATEPNARTSSSAITATYIMKVATMTPWLSEAVPTTSVGHVAIRRAATSSTPVARCSYRQGFFSTSIGDLVTTSGVGTRGAFYHHFKDKAELFRAVFEEVERDLTLRSLASPPPGADPWERLSAGLHGFLESALEPEVQRVMLLDGPVVLGWQTLREIEEGNSVALINEMVREAIAEGIIDDQPVGELTHMVIAALEEAALLVAHAPDPTKARERAARVLDRMLFSFSVEPRKTVRR